MAEGYCVKCKAKKPISDAVEEIMKNGRKAIKGRCPTCGTVMFKILGGKATVVAPPTPNSPAAGPKPVDPGAPAPDQAGPSATQPAGEKSENNPG